MDRLTERNGDSVFILSKVTGWTRSSNWSEPAENAIHRLAAYEDSGLSPEEVQKLKKSDASKEQCTIDQHGEIHRLRDELKRYKQAEQDGRLVVLPCKRGDKVWFVRGGRTDYGYVKWWIVAVVNPPKGPIFFEFDDFGKTVFLTREEAEKAIGGGKK